MDKKKSRKRNPSVSKSILIGSSLLMANLSAENLVGLAGQSYEGDMSGMAWEVTAIVPIMIMAVFLLPVYVKNGFTSLPGFLENFYGKGIRRLVSFFFLSGYLLVGIPVCLYAGGLACESLVDVGGRMNIQKNLAVFLCMALAGLVGTAGVWIGKIKSVLWLDFFLSILLSVSCILIVVLGFWKAGGLVVLQNHPEKWNAVGDLDSPVPAAAIFPGLFLANLFYWGTNQITVQRVLEAGSLKEGQKGIFLSAFLKLFVPFLVVLPGILAASLSEGRIKNSNKAYPFLIAEVLPDPLKIVVAGVLFLTVVSAFQAFLNAAVSLFPVQEKPRKRRTATVLFGLISIGVSPVLFLSQEGIYDFGRSYAGFYSIPVILLVLNALLGRGEKERKRTGAFLAFLWHLVFYSGYKFWFSHLNYGLFQWISKLPFLFIYGISAVVMAGILLFYSRDISCLKRQGRGQGGKEETKPVKVQGNVQAEVRLKREKETGQKQQMGTQKKEERLDMKNWEKTGFCCMILSGSILYEYFLFSPAGLAGNVIKWDRIGAVTAGFIGFVFVIMYKKNKSTKTKNKTIK